MSSHAAITGVLLDLGNVIVTMTAETGVMRCIVLILIIPPATKHVGSPRHTTTKLRRVYFLPGGANLSKLIP